MYIIQLFKYVLSAFNLSVVDFGNYLFGALFVNWATERKACSQYLLDCSCEVLCHWFLFNNFCYFFDLLEGEVSFMVYVLDFFSVSLVVSKFFDEKSWWAWFNVDFSCSVLALQLNHNSDSFPFWSFFDDILTDFLGVLYYWRGTSPRGPNLGASVAAGPGSPPKTLILTK